MDSIKNCKNVNNEALENRDGGPMASKTSGTKNYEIKIGFANLIIIDTPGFGDSRGTKFDNDHLEKIKKTVTTEKGINCICVV